MGVWTFLIAARASEIRSLPVLGPADSLEDFGYLPQEARWLMGFWLNSGVAAPVLRPSSWMKKVLAGEYANARGSFWSEENRDRIAQDAAKVRHWKVTLGAHTEAPDVEATWHIDPPYQKAGKYYVHGSDAIDFDTLGAWCRARRGQTMVCENAGATWLPFRTFRTFKGTEGGVRTGKSEEVIWTNQEAQSSS